MVEPRKTQQTPPAVKSRPQLPESWMSPSQGNSAQPSRPGDRPSMRGLSKHLTRKSSTLQAISETSGENNSQKDTSRSNDNHMDPESKQKDTGDEDITDFEDEESSSDKDDERENSGERQTSQAIVFLERNTSSQEFVRRRLSPPRRVRQESTSEDGETIPDDAASREAKYPDDQDEVSFDDTIDSYVSDGENEFSEPDFPRFKRGEECILLYKGCACKARITDIQEKEGVLQYKVTFKYCIWFLHLFVRFDQELGQLFKLNPENPMTPDTPIQTPGEGVFPDGFMGPSPPKDFPTNTKDVSPTNGQTIILTDSSQQVLLASEIPLGDHRETIIPYSDTVPTLENEAEPEIVKSPEEIRATSGKETTRTAPLSPDTEHVKRMYPRVTGSRPFRSILGIPKIFIDFDGKKESRIIPNDTDRAGRDINDSSEPSEATVGSTPADPPQTYQNLKRKATKEKKDIPSTSDASSKQPSTKMQKVKETEPRVTSEGPQNSPSSDSSPNTSPKNVKKSKRD